MKLSPTAKMSLVVGVVVGTLLSIVLVLVFSLTGDTPYDRNEGVRETYAELGFMIVHRPHLTYLIDTRYYLCFATRKPNYQDLVQFPCPEKLWKEAEEGTKSTK